MKQQTTTRGTPSRPTLPTRNDSHSLWKVQCRIVGMAYHHAWAGEADHSEAARDKAMAAARRDWPGCSIAVVSVVQVA